MTHRKTASARLDRSLRRRVLACQRMAHRCLGMNRDRLGLGLDGAGRVAVAVAGIALGGGLVSAGPAQAQVFNQRLANFANVCTGLSTTLPVTQPVQGAVLTTLTTLGLDGLTTTLNQNFAALNGRTIGTTVLDANGNLLTSGNCGVSSSSGFAINNNSGITLGGGIVTGLGGISNNGATTGDVTAIAIGNNANAATANAVALGTGAQAIGGRSVSIGAGNTANGNGAVAIGDPNVATGLGAVAMGADNTSTGTGAVAIGNQSRSTGAGAVALGNASTALADGTVAIGNNASGFGGNAVAIGANATANNSTQGQQITSLRNPGTLAQIVNGAQGQNSSDPTGTAIGSGSVVNGGGGVALGFNNVAGATVAGGTFASTAVGINNLANGVVSTALGDNNTASGTAAIAIGVNNVASGFRGIAIGRDALASGNLSIAQGTQASGYGANSLALGANSVAGVNGGAAANDVALGAGAVSTLGNSVALGAGSVASRGAEVAYGGYAVGASTSVGEVAVGTALAPRTLTGVAPGRLGTDAVNVTQLNGVGTALSGSLGGGAGFNATTGVYTPPAYTVANGTFTDVGAALTALNAQAVSGQVGGFVSNNAALAAGPVATGANASAGGFGSSATGAASTVVGNAATDNGNANAVALGNGASVLGAGSIAIGQGTTANTSINTDTITDFRNGGTLRQINNLAAGTTGFVPTGVAIGALSTVGNKGGVAIGYNNNAGNTPGSQPSFALGANNLASGNNSLALGLNNTASNVGAIAIGTDSQGTGARSIAMGRAAFAFGDFSIAQGYLASGYGPNAVAIGANSVAGVNGGAAANDIALGAGAVSTLGNSVALGAGSVASRGAEVAYGGYAVGASTSVGEVAVGTALAPRTLTGVAPGRLGTDAVNVTQLNGVGTALSGSLGGGAGFNATTGAYTAPTYTVANGTFNDVGAALTALNAQALSGQVGGFVSNNAALAAGPVATGANASAGGFGSSATGASSTVVGNAATDNANPNATVLGNGAQVAAGTAGSNVALGQGSTVIAAAVPVAGATIGTTPYTFAGAVPAGAVSVGAIGAERQIQNVAAGRLTAASTDAVNGSQLFATNQQVGVNGTAITTLNTGLANGTVGPVQRAGADQLVAVAPGGTAGVPGIAQRLSNIAAGTVAGNSGDAINGSQLFGASQSVATALGGATTVNANGTITAPNYTVAGTNYTSVGAALGALDTGLAGGQVGAFRADNTAGAAAPVVTGANAVAGGFGTAATGAGSTVIGTNATDNANPNATVLGNGAQVAAGVAGSNVALGQGSVVTAAAVPVAGATIGATPYTFAGTIPAGAVSVGTAGAERQIQNVAAGRLTAASTDAINGSQLFATNQQVGANTTAITDLNTAVGGGTLGPLQRGAANQLVAVAIGGTAAAPGAAQRLSNVAAGTVGAGSTDALNGSQLFGASQSVAAALGGGTTVNADGTVSAPGYTVAGTTYTSVGTALNALDTGLASGQVGAFRADNTANAVAPVAGGANAVAGGFGAVASGAGSTVLGSGASDNGNAAATVLGSGAQVAAGIAGSNVALGQGSTVTVAATPVAGATVGGTAYTFAGGAPAGAVSVGAAGAERQIQNVAAGRLTAASTDAINGSQLFATNQQVGANTTAIGDLNSGAVGTIQRGGADQLVAVALGGTAGAPGAAQRLGNIAAGTVGAGSTDALNGSQLFSTSQSIAAALGGNTTVNPDGTLSNPSYAVGGTTYGNVGSALTALNAGLNGGQVGAFQADNTANAAAPVASGANAVAGGFGTVASGAGSTVIGSGASDNGNAAATVFGNGARIAAGLTGSNVALGQGSVVGAAAVPVAGATVGGTAYTFAGGAPAGAVSIGAAGAERQIQNVAAGQLTAASTDAVNGSQLYATNQQVGANTTAIASLNSGAVGTIQRGGADQLVAVGIGGTAGAPGAAQRLSNIAAGTVGAGSTDAINGSQLFGASQSVATALGGGSTTNADGSISAPQYTVGGATYGSVGSALGALDAGLANGQVGAFRADNTAGAAAPVTSGANAAAGGYGAIASGAGAVALGSGAQASGTNSVALGAGSTDGGLANVVSVGAVGAERRITNVATGVAATDAANVGQVSQLAARSVQYDTNADGSTNRSSITLDAGGGPVTIRNVAAGVAPTDAATVGQLSAGLSNTVQYATNPNGTRSNTLALVGGDPTAPVTVSNVAAGRVATDAVNVGQLNQGLNNLQQLVNYQFQSAKRAAYGGTAIALASASLRWDDRPGKVSLALGGAGYHGAGGVAVGLGGTSEDGTLRYNVSAAFSPDERKTGVGVSGGLTFTLN